MQQETVGAMLRGGGAAEALESRGAGCLFGSLSSFQRLLEALFQFDGYQAFFTFFVIYIASMLPQSLPRQ
jgi:hypothetical protein